MDVKGNISDVRVIKLKHKGMDMTFVHHRIDVNTHQPDWPKVVAKDEVLEISFADKEELLNLINVLDDFKDYIMVHKGTWHPSRKE